MSQQQKYSTSGIVHETLDPVQRGNFEAQTLILKIEGYNGREEFAAFEFFGKSMPQIASLEPGDGVTVEWELKGRESKGRYYTTLSGWKATRTSQGRGRDDRQPARSGSPDRNFARPGDEPRSRYQEPGEADRDIDF